MSMHPGGGPTRGPARFLSDGDGDGGWDDSMGERLLSALDAFSSSPSNLLAPPVPVIFAPLRLASDAAVADRSFALDSLSDGLGRAELVIDPGSSKVSPLPCARAASRSVPRDRTLAPEGLVTSVADCAKPSGRALDVTCCVDGGVLMSTTRRGICGYSKFGSRDGRLSGVSFGGFERDTGYGWTHREPGILPLHIRRSLRRHAPSLARADAPNTDSNIELSWRVDN